MPKLDKNHAATPNTIQALLLVLLGKSHELCGVNQGLNAPHLTLRTRDGGRTEKTIIWEPIQFFAHSVIAYGQGRDMLKKISESVHMDLAKMEKSTYLVPVCRIRGSLAPKQDERDELMARVSLFFQSGYELFERWLVPTSGHFISMVINVDPFSERPVRVRLIDSMRKSVFVSSAVNASFYSLFVCELNDEILKHRAEAHLASQSGMFSSWQDTAKRPVMGGRSAVSPRSVAHARVRDLDESDSDTEAEDIYAEAKHLILDEETIYLGLQKDNTSCGYWTAATLLGCVRGNIDNDREGFLASIHSGFQGITECSPSEKHEMEQAVHRIVVEIVNSPLVNVKQTMKGMRAVLAQIGAQDGRSLTTAPKR